MCQTVTDNNYVVLSLNEKTIGFSKLFMFIINDLSWLSEERQGEKNRFETILSVCRSLSLSKNLFQVDLGFSSLFHACPTRNYLFRANSAPRHLFKNIPPPPRSLNGGPLTKVVT